MARDLRLKQKLELAGLTVTEVDDWHLRGSETFSPRGSVNHHTAGPKNGVAPSLGTCINGRPDVNGPLCNVFGPREESLRVVLVAAGRANHAGRGGYKGLVGNSSVYGLEEEHPGYAWQPISPLRVDRMARVHAAFAFGTFDETMVCQHHEWTERKIDFCEDLLSPTIFRRLVKSHILAMSGAGPTPNPEDFIMDAQTKQQMSDLLDEKLAGLNVAALKELAQSGGAVLVRVRGSGTVWVTNFITRRHVSGPSEAKMIEKALGLPASYPNYIEVDADLLEQVPVVSE
jgi:hypothetical protein